MAGHRVFNLLENAQRARSISDWPPYDIVKTGDDSYRISIVVAGFAQDDLDITFQSNLLTVTGRKQEAPTDGYLHRGIAGQPFEQRFELADHLRVNGADLKNGLLSVDLVREIPDALKPRKIDIQSEHVLASPAAPAQIEAQKAA
ncbi:Hsp20 family protein [Rhizobium sp. NZLR1b]|uniref:Hsp20 family protein n=1 Tax=Rhizobium sp. NZLR1b TaxID=2731099 RepID=UPI00287FD284|nr:Hsp20 family protein [Rhizobium sp. NZLR1b]